MATDAHESIKGRSRRGAAPKVGRPARGGKSPRASSSGRAGRAAAREVVAAQRVWLGQSGAVQTAPHRRRRQRFSCVRERCWMLGRRHGFGPGTAAHAVSRRSSGEGGGVKLHRRAYASERSSCDVRPKTKSGKRQQSRASASLSSRPRRLLAQIERSPHHVQGSDLDHQSNRFEHLRGEAKDHEVAGARSNF